MVNYLINKVTRSDLMMNAYNYVSKRKTTIATAIGIAGMIASTIEAVSVTPKAVKRIEEKKKARGISENDKLSIIDTIKTCGDLYFFPAFMIVISSGCIIFAHAEDNKRSAMFAAAYTVSENNFRAYREATKKIVGEDTHNKIVKESKSSAKTSDGCSVIVSNNSMQCFIDPMSGREFYSTVTRINDAINELNYRMFDEMYVSLNDLYYELGLSSTETGEILGWNIDGGKIRVSFDAIMSGDYKACIALDYCDMLKSNFNKL